MIYTTSYPSPIGPMLLAEEDGALIGVWFEGQKYFPAPFLQMQQETPLLRQTKDWLNRYFAGEQPDPHELPLAPKGSPFRRQVWQVLLEIPSGSTMTYGQIAGRIHSSMSAQAVGGAVGHNPISVIIPCHRVVGSDGSLTGYAGGLDRKKYLLELEAQI